MGQKSKKGKQRKDKYYHLAKESGYRARSAFKLIQLDRKLKLFESSRVAIDLCAAPGGWLQVMQNTMPLSSIIIGVDIVPIKPIPNVITLQEDITTDQCVSAISKSLASWKADIVLNDGAPNVGQSWVQDAFSQSKLTLAAFKIATRFLKKGGCFITKVFRSKDYLALNWAFKQLFLKVKATKPQASRNESAEIYVICQNYKAPDKIDAKFFDIRHVFKDLDDPDAPTQRVDKLMIGQPQTKAKALGYDENSLLVYKKVPVLEFLKTDSYIPMLNYCSELKIDDPDILEHRETTDEIKQLCEDVQLIGRKEVKMLLKWRSKMRSVFAAKLEISEEAKVPQHKDQTPALTEEEKEQQLEHELTKLEKKKKAKLREQKVKLRQKMVLGSDSLMETDETLFSLTAMKSKRHLDEYENNAEKDFNEGPNDEEYKEEQRIKTLERARVDQGTRNEWMDDLYSEDEDGNENEEIEFESDSDEDQPNETENNEDLDNDLQQQEPNPLVASVVQTMSVAQKANLWYASHDVFDGLIKSNDNDVDLEKELAEEEENEILRNKTEMPQTSEIQPESKARRSSRAVDKAQGVAMLAMGGSARKTNPFDDDHSSDEEDEDFPDDPHSSESEEDVNVSRTAKVSAKRKLTAEQLALGHELAFSAKRRREIIESGFNRYVYDDDLDALPSWFKHDEERVSKQMVPLNKELVQMYRDRLKEINARPIKKVAEARARKKQKTLKKLENIRGKAEKIASAEGTSEREKLLQIKGLYKKAKVNKKFNKEKTYVVAKKKSGKAVNPSKSKSKKGPVKFVDRRMKADKRKKMKNSEKKNKKLLTLKQTPRKGQLGKNKKRPKSR